MRKKKIVDPPDVALTTGTPTPREEVELGSNPLVSYIGSSVEYGFLQADRALPRTIDDAEADFGENIYDRMANDAILGGAEAYLKVLALSVDLNVNPSIEEPPKETATPEQIAAHKSAKEMSDFGQAMLDGLAQSDRPIGRILWDMLDAMRKGHRLAEVTARVAVDGDYVGKLVVDAIRPKPRKNYAFVLDEYNTFRGVIAVVPGVSIALRQGIVAGLEGIPNAISPDKLLVLTFGGKDGDPRGQSWFRRAYDPWYRKQIVKPESVKTAVQFGGGMITAILPELQGQTDVMDPSGSGKMVHMQKAIQWSLSQLHNGGTATFPFGTLLKVDRPEGDGKYFESFFDRCDREMVTTFLLSSRAMLEARHGSKADTSESKDTVDDLVQYVRQALCEMIEGLIRRFIVLNWGEARALKESPKCTMQITSKPDFAENATAVAQLVEAGYVAPSQKPAIDRDILGLQEATPGDQAPFVMNAGLGDGGEDPASAGNFPVPDGKAGTLAKEKPVVEADNVRPGAATNRQGLRAIDEGRSAAAGKAKRAT